MTLEQSLPRWIRSATRHAETQREQLTHLADFELAERYRALRKTPASTNRAGAMVLALMSEACRRRLDLQPRPEQLVGAVALAGGCAAEMRTGEGKTLALALAAACHALPGTGVHVLTANDYLAQRDAHLLTPAFALLGLSTAVITASNWRTARRAAHQADILYATVSEVGFDHLRDQLAATARDRVTRRPHAALLDEADAVLIDDASTPLVITSVEKEGGSVWPARIAPLIPALRPVLHYEGNLAERHLDFTDLGWHTLHQQLRLDERSWRDPGFLAAAQNALHAYLLYQDGRDYLVTDEHVVLLDPHTGRALPQRRLSDGLHAALEAKEGLPVRAEPRTLATISIQRFLRRYPVLAGISGTLRSEAVELHEVYRLPVVRVPTRKPVVRRELPDELFATDLARTAALVEHIADAHRTGRPVLVGVPTIRAAEQVSRHLDELGVNHTTLTARDNAQEAAIIAGAGRLGAVTVATALAGRGTDIRLGGDPPEHADRARELGGLLVLGVGRGRTRRVDNQLAGRAGRQGDPGTVRFLLSAEDDLLQDNNPTAVRSLTTVGSRPVTGRAVHTLIQRVQSVADTRQYLARKQMLRLDEIIGHQHDALSDQRAEVLATPLPLLLNRFARAAAASLWDSDEQTRSRRLRSIGAPDLPTTSSLSEDGLAAALHDHLVANEHTRGLILTALDDAWSRQLATLLALQSASHTATWSRADPVAEYRHQAVRAYQAARREFQLDLLRRLLADSPQWTLPARRGSSR
ncbi:hypothetical protein N8J89_16740 [Crossiella sp. CA-258035]|uniref:preprotein translocase subunit SecA n=1 Tax=Crossiella sp. CA-258035 TaxID=2981138 RepID=UPI0024BD4E37|nr:hypothetical protein [Crossiella sp. CA-258035]WHT22646.1 hypothetical protein N8J89_16740 [Crossiella sp. CA-258035]